MMIHLEIIRSNHNTRTSRVLRKTSQWLERYQLERYPSRDNSSRTLSTNSRLSSDCTRKSQDFQIYQDGNRY